MSFQPTTLTYPMGWGSQGSSYPTQCYHIPSCLPYAGAMSNQTGLYVAEPTYVRKRIAIACGRCRKRKIRCSGGGNGVWCANCAEAKRAGKDIEDCVFNPVGKTGVPEERDQLHPTGMNAANHQVVDWKTYQLTGWERSPGHDDAFHQSQADSRFPSTYGLGSEIYTPTSHAFSKNGYMNFETAPSDSISVPALRPLASGSLELPPILPFSAKASSFSQSGMHHPIPSAFYETAGDVALHPQRQSKVNDQNLPKVTEVRYHVGHGSRNGYPSSSSRQTVRDPLATRYYGGVIKSKASSGGAHHRYRLNTEQHRSC